MLLHQAGDINDHRGLAGTSEGDVSDRYDAAGKPPCPEDAGRIRRRTEMDEQTIDQGEGKEKSPRKSGSLPSIHDIFDVRLIEQ